MKESPRRDLLPQRAEQFLNTFYFQYGHGSIADLAHIPFAIERLSLLAAISLVDEQRWDGQERSTRYQNFRKSGWFTPAASRRPRPPAYTAAVEALFTAYDQVGAEMLVALKQAIPQPAEMKDEAYTRTLKARAFDVARYLLPLATNTSLGQIVNARTLETQISRLLTSEFAEIRTLGTRLRQAASEPAWNVTHATARVLCDEVNSVNEDCGCRVSEALLRDVKAAPTLVKYAAPSDYTIASRTELRAAAAELMSGQPIEPAPVVDLVEDAGPLEVELATSRLSTPACHHSWRQLQRTVAALPRPTPCIAELIALGTKHRTRHDELPAPSPPARASSSTSSWTSAASATCTATAAASSSSRTTPTSTATKTPPAPASPPSPKPASPPPTPPRWTPPSPSLPPTPPQTCLQTKGALIHDAASSRSRAG